MTVSRKPQVRVTLPMIRRMRQLTAAGLSRTATATVIAVDFKCEPPDPSTVRFYAPDSPLRGREENFA